MIDKDFNKAEVKEFCMKVADQLRKDGALKAKDNGFKVYHPFTNKPE